MIGAGCDILWVRRDISVLQSEGWFLTLYDLYAWSCSPSLNVTDQPNEMRFKILRWCCYVVAGFSPRHPATKLCTQGLRVIIRVSRNLPSLPATPGTNIASRPRWIELKFLHAHVLASFSFFMSCSSLPFFNNIFPASTAPSSHMLEQLWIFLHSIPQRSHHFKFHGGCRLGGHHLHHRGYRCQSW